MADDLDDKPPAPPVRFTRANLPCYRLPPAADPRLLRSGFRQSCSGSETDVSASTSTENLTHEEKYVLWNSTRQEPQGEENLDDQMSFNTLVIHENLHHGGMHNYTEKPPPSTQPSLPGVKMQQRVLQSPKPMPRRTSNPPSVVPYQPGSEYSWQNEQRFEQELMELSEALVRKPCSDTYSFPPPPAYSEPFTSELSKPGTVQTKLKLSVSRSQPDLSDAGLRLWDEKLKDKFPSPRPKTRGRASFDGDHEARTCRSGSALERLTKENLALNAELEAYYRKVSRLQQFDLEVQKVHQSYEDLVKSSEKRESLSRAVRMKLEMEIKRLQDLCRDLKGKASVASMQQMVLADDSELRKELTRRDLLISQVITQNKELVAAKERQEIELAAQRATLHEQRTHIDILDSALNNAQENVVKLEEECRKKQVYVERVSQLQKALASLQLASEKREQMEKKLRNQLEKEIQELLVKKEGQLSGGDSKNEEMEKLKRELRDREERLMAFQAEVSKWEQRYLEESAIRQIAIDAASMPKDAKIAALERTSQESERLIAQARSEKLRQMDEMHASNKKCADFEAKTKDLESKLAEKEAMIKVLQKHSLDKDVAYQNAILRSPRHTPHPSLSHVPMSAAVGSEEHSDVALSGTGAHGSATGGVSSSSASSLTTMSSNPPSHGVSSSSKSFDATIDRQLKELDSQLLSKDSIIHALRAEKEKYPNHFWRV